MAERQETTGPGATPATIHRPRLTQDLEAQIGQRKLILVIAPPGYGKSSLLADFAQTSDIPVCSLQLKMEDRQPAVLAARLASALVKRFRRLRDVLPAGGLTGEELTAEAIAQAIAAKVPEQHVLMVDGLEILVEADEANRFLSRLIKSSPAQTMLVLAGRQLPALSLAELVAADQVKSYSAVELTLDYQEMVELVEARTGSALSGETADALYERTEGWITGVLLSEAVQPAFVSAGLGRSLVEEYFHEVAFEGLSEALSRFLLESSLLPVFNAELCDLALARDDSQAMIEQLLRSGCYLFREGYYTDRFYRYQYQYQRFLLERADFSSERIGQVVGRAVEWYQQHELPEFAFDLSVMQGDYATAKAIADEWASRVYVKKRFELLRHWEEKLSDCGHQSAELFRVLGLISHYSQRSPLAALEYLDQAATLAIQNNEPQFLFRILTSQLSMSYMLDVNSDRAEMLARIEELRGDISGGDLSRYYTSLMKYELWDNNDPIECLNHFEEAMKHLNPAYIAEPIITKAIASSCLGNHEAAYLELRKAEKVSLENHQLHNRPFIQVNLATSAQYLGKYFEAFFTFLMSIESSTRDSSEDYLLMGYVGLAEFFIDLRYFEIAQQYLVKAQNILQAHIQLDTALYYLFLTKYYRLRGMLEDARLALRRINRSEIDWTYDYAKEIERVLLGHPFNQLDALNEFKKVKDSVKNNRTGAFCIDVEILKLLVATSQRDEANQLAGQLLEMASQYDLYHFLVIEARQNSPIFSLLAESETEARDEFLQRVQELEQVRKLFRFILPELDHGMLFRSFGEIEIKASSDQEAQLRPIHQEVLYFLLENEQTSKEELLEQIWPDLPANKQSSNMHSAIYEIRGALGPEIIQVVSGRYSMNPIALEAYDAKAFIQAAASLNTNERGQRQTLGSYQGALSLYRGDFLPGVYSQWVIDRREYYREVYQNLLIRFSRAAVAQNSSDYVIDKLREAIASDPLNEDLAEVYMELLFQSNSIPAMLTFYRRFELRMEKDLQLRPGRNLRDLVRRAQSDPKRRIAFENLDW